MRTPGESIQEPTDSQASPRPRHAHLCGGHDHHTGLYTEKQRADLDLVLAFNQDMATAIDRGLDVTAVEEELDPDPLRYMWVDEGAGRIPEMLDAARTVLDAAPPRPGHRRIEAAAVPDSVGATRPSVCTGPQGARLLAWIEWVPEEGDVLCVVRQPAGAAPGPVERVTDGVLDLHRPTALIGADGTPWVFYGAGPVAGEVAVWAIRHDGDAWTEPERVSTGVHPAFNQEVALTADGAIELCWQGRAGDRFAVFSRRHDGAWGPTATVTEGVEVNVWDPAVAVLADGTVVHAWSEFRDGRYRISLRRTAPDGSAGAPVLLPCADGYALHPSLAVTADQRVWCAYDLVRVPQHGGSGPTRLRPAPGEQEDPDGKRWRARAGGAEVPPELLREISSEVVVVCVAEDGRVDVPPGELAAGLDVVPAALPRLCATADGGLTVVYRIHRKLPLMTFYWEVAAQGLGPAGWLPPVTLRHSDGTLEEVGVAADADGVVLALQTDHRLERALRWTEGFGGRECPYLLDHHGSVVWHGVHGTGVVATASVPGSGSAPEVGLPADSAHVDDPAVPGQPSATRDPARRWTAAESPQRYVARLPGREYALFWGDLHRHSLISRCTAGDEPHLEDFYRYAWDVCEYDFWAVTDHSENSSPFQWWGIQKMADLFHIPDRFVPLYGFEWTSADHGHQNVIYGDVERGAPIFSAFADGSTDPAGLWAGLAEHPAYPAITIPHHPGAAMVYNDWDFHDPRYSRLVEVFQACRGSYEAPGGFRQYADAIIEGTFTADGLARGYRFGLIASSDHGFGASYVGAYATSLERADVFDALWQRRTFAATTRDVLLDVRLGDDGFLGEELIADGPRTLHVHGEGYTDLARVEIVRDGRVVHVHAPQVAPPGWLEVPLRVEWGGSPVTTSWDGDLSVRGGRVVATPFVSPEIVAVTGTAVRWRASTQSFGATYGAQRGCVELTLVGPDDASVELRCGARSAEVSLARLASGEPVAVPGDPGHLVLQRGTGGLSSLGTRSVDLSWTDDAAPDRPAYYYVRLLQTDGEMAWSSPIWVDPDVG